ncbi:hypothetical protein F443_07794 [Phytophthora nicotianae P1569]|uniref:Uncharacterized protein n=1 Tax=Phytophthora nicotianae P1569 TaxID=1317065 RepID=V9FCK8_PHYNI|nr:hypothetical protein F443_07794 [Phytophthora nicotianae P1569]
MAADQPSSNNSADSDFEDVPATQAAASNEDYGVNGRAGSNAEEACWAVPKREAHLWLSLRLVRHQNLTKLRRLVSINLDGFNRTCKTWDEFEEELHQLHCRAFQPFSKRESNSIAVRNKQMENLWKANSATGKCKREGKGSVKKVVSPARSERDYCWINFVGKTSATQRIYMSPVTGMLPM